MKFPNIERAREYVQSLIDNIIDLVLKIQSLCDNNSPDQMEQMRDEGSINKRKDID